LGRDGGRSHFKQCPQAETRGPDRNQRKSTPHLIGAKKLVVEAGLLGKIGQVDMCCYFHMRANGNPPVEPVPDFFDYEMWTGPAPLRPYDGLPHLRWWRTFMEYGNGIVGDMCVHMFDTTRWMLGLGWPKRVNSAGGIFVQKEGKSNITDTQSATFEYDDLTCNWEHRTWEIRLIQIIRGRYSFTEKREC
jgi:predicted dehydrogenase